MQVKILSSLPFFSKTSKHQKTSAKKRKYRSASQKVVELFVRPHSHFYLVKKHLHIIILSLLILAFIGYYITASFARFDNYYTGRYDLGNMTQVVWNTAHGRIFQLTYENGIETVSRLSVHADFILMLFAPLYWIWDSPKVLLFFQALIAGLGGYFVYGIALHVLKNKNHALAFAFSYLLYPALGWMILFDFHAVALATTFLLGTVYFLLKKRYFLFILFALLAALTKEQIWFVIAFFGPILFFRDKKKLLGTIFFFVSLGMFFFLLWYAIPKAAEATGYFALEYFENGITSPTQIVQYSLLHPTETVIKLLAADRLDYLNQLFMPLGYLSVFFPFWLVFTIADFALNLLSDKEELHQIYFHYTAVLIPFLFLCAIYGLKMLKQFFPYLFYKKLGLYFSKEEQKKLARVGVFISVIYIVSFSIYGAYLYGPLPGTQTPNDEMFVMPLEQRKEFDAILADIPVENSVASVNELGAQLSHREHIYSLAIDVRAADYVAFFVRDPDQNEAEFHSDLVKQMENDPNYKKWYDNNGLLIFKKANL